MGSGTVENEKIAAAGNPAQAVSIPVHPLKPVIRHLLKNAAMCAIIFLLAHLLGLREYTSVMSGTASFGTFKSLLGIIYFMLYLGFVFLMPVFIIAAGLLEIVILTTKSKHSKTTQNQPQNYQNNMLFYLFKKICMRGRCNCQAIQNYVNDGNSPIEYDPKLNEYNIIYEKDRGVHCKIQLYFCFFCRGKLPKSNRGKLFTKPSVVEIFKAGRLIRNIKTEKDIVKILGEPDRKMSFDKPPFSELPEEERSKRTFHHEWKAQYEYTSKWNTLDVLFTVYQNGKTDSAIAGKYIGEKNP